MTINIRNPDFDEPRDRDGGGGGDSNGHPPRVVPVPEPGKARVAASERFEAKKSDD